MLPAVHRLTDADSFRVAVRGGRRAGSRSLVAHLATGDGAGPARVGLVVSKAVGNAVVRNRVKRRLRHLAREQLVSLPGAAVLVLRAQPAAADASYDALRRDLERCLARVLA